MKMRLMKVGAGSFGDGPAFYATMQIPEDIVATLKAFEGQEVDVKIEPSVRFRAGDRVTRRKSTANVGGTSGAEVITQHTIRSGPHVFEGKPGTFWLPYDSNEFIPDGELAPYTNGEW